MIKQKNVLTPLSIARVHEILKWSRNNNLSTETNQATRKMNKMTIVRKTNPLINYNNNDQIDSVFTLPVN